MNKVLLCTCDVQQVCPTYEFYLNLRKDYLQEYKKIMKATG